MKKTSWQEKYVDRFYRNRPGYVSYHEEWLGLLDRSIEKNSVIVDLGAGPTNDTTRFLSDRAASLIGVDVDPEVMENRYLDDAHVYDGTKIPLPDACADVVTSHWVVEHITNPEEHCREVCRVLRPGGIYVFRTPNLYHYKTIGALLIPNSMHTYFVRRLRNRTTDAHDPYPTHYRLNSEGRIRKEMERSGLKVDAIHYGEGLPSYGMSSRVLFLLFMAYERVVNSSRLFRRLRHTIDCVGRKATLE